MDGRTITAMTEIIAIAFWTIVITAGLAAAFLGIAHDDPRGRADYVPPRSYHEDMFERTGSSFR